MRKCLRKISKLPFLARIVFLGKKSQVVSQVEQALKHHPAVYDAVVSAWHWKDVYRRDGPKGPSLVPVGADPSYPSEHAAIAGAASRVLAYLFPRDAHFFMSRAAEDAASRVWAGIHFRSACDEGMRLGGKVAQTIIDWAKSDGS